MGDVVLKIDADAARYIAETIKAAEKSKELGKGAKEAKTEFAGMGDILEAGVAKLGRMVSAAGIYAAAGAAVVKVWTDYAAALERGDKAAKSIADALRHATGSAGDLKSLGSARDQIVSMPSSLQLEQRVSAYGAFRGNAPNATSAQAVAAVRAASQAHVAGMDSTEFAGAQGKLHEAYGDQAGDATAFLLQRGQAQGGAAVDEMAELSAKIGPEKAREALGLVSAAARTRGGLGVLSPLVSSYIQRGARGSFTDYAATAGRGEVSAEQLPILKQVQGRIDAERSASGNLKGYLQGQAIQGMSTQIDQSRLATEMINARTESDSYELRAETASTEALKKAQRENFDNATKGGVGIPFAARSARLLGFAPNPSDARREAVQAIGGGNPVVEAINNLPGKLRAPAIGTHGESGH